MTWKYLWMGFREEGGQKEKKQERKQAGKKERKKESEKEKKRGSGALFICSAVLSQPLQTLPSFSVFTRRFTHICTFLLLFNQIFSLLFKSDHHIEPIQAFKNATMNRGARCRPGGARLNLAWGIPQARGHGWCHGAADLKVGTPQGVSVAPRHGHHNSKRGGNKSAPRTQRLLDTSGEIRWSAHWWSTTLA